MSGQLTSYGAIWDLDGVLVDSAPFHRQAWQALAAELGHSFSDEDFRRTFGMRNPEIIASVFGTALSAERVEALGERKEQAFRALARGRVRAIAGAVELLQSLARDGLCQALATSTPRANVELILRELGIDGCFQAVVTAEDVQVGKPNPEGFLLAASLLRLPPERCVVLEDAVAGAEAATAAGMRCVALAGARPLDQFARSLPPHCLVVQTLENLAPERLLALLRESG